MKRTISMFLAAVIIFLALTSCDPSSVPPSPSQTLTPTTEAFPEPSYLEIPYSVRHFSSVEELYQGLLDYSEDALETIRTKESNYIKSSKRYIYLSNAELENGVFGNFRKTLLRKEMLMFPFYRNEPLPLYAPESAPEKYFSLYEFGSFGGHFHKSWICYSVEVEDTTFTEGDVFLTVGIMFYDSALIEEATEKGASWLLTELEPDGFNVTAFEKKVSLWDRDVLAMVLDYGNDENPYLQVYIVYDDILINVSGSPEIIEAVLPHLTFREIHMPTGEPVRDTPGRDWSEGGVEEE